MSYHSRGNFLNPDQLAVHTGQESASEAAKEKQWRLEKAAASMLEALKAVRRHAAGLRSGRQALMDLIESAIAEAEGRDG